MEYSTFLQKVCQILDQHYELDDFLECRWLIEGADGGSWTGTQAHRMIPEQPPHWDDIEQVLSILAPEITLRDYNRLLALVDVGKYSQTEYYGNYSVHQYKRLSLRDFYNFLIENHHL